MYDLTSRKEQMAFIAHTFLTLLINNLFKHFRAKPNEIEAKHSSGLVKGHNYSVTAVETVKARTRSGEIDVPLIRVRNPWGNEREWEGPWSDKYVSHSCIL